MKTIEQEANEYLKHTVGTISENASKHVIIDFKAGFESAQIWIPIEEEKPELRVPVLVKMSYNFFNTDISAKDCCYWNGESWINAIRQQHSNGSVTHWRPIERF